MNESEKELDDTYRDYAWKYFSLHSDQRIKTFQFYVAFSTTIIGGLLILIKEGHPQKWMGLIGFLLTALSFVFWKLDVRTKEMIKNSELALKYLDDRYNLPDIEGKPNPLSLFRSDDYGVTANNQAGLGGHFSYSRCFRWVFASFAIVGIAACAWCIKYGS